MPAKIFIISNKASKQIFRLPLRIQEKVDRSFDVIKTNPLSGIKLEGELSDKLKFRVGDYRIIYRFNSKESRVEILKVEHRQGVYK